MKSIIVVGGGAAGLLSALLCARKGKKVCLIEEEPECGGLLRSFTRNGIAFDYGSHFLRQTGNQELDNLLFEELDVKKWQRLPFLRNGTFFQGKMYEHSCFVDIRSLPKSLYEQCILEIMQLNPGPKEQYKTNEEFVLQSFGPTLLTHLFRPALKKLLGTDPSQLSPDVLRFFDLPRVIAFTPQISRELKRSPVFDRRIAFHFSYEGQAGLINYYPIQGGIGQWVEWLTSQLISLGVEILTETRIEEIFHENRNINSVRLVGGRAVPCDSLIWSAVVPPLLKTAQLPFQTTKANLRLSNLYYYVFDKPIQTECQYFVNFDPEFRSFRISCYSNFRSAPSERAINAVCVEVIDDTPDLTGQYLNEIESELKKMGVLPNNSVSTFREAKVARAGFPVYTPDFVKNTSSMLHFVEESLANLTVVGKGTGRTFFTGETLLDVFDKVSKIL